MGVNLDGRALRLGVAIRGIGFGDGVGGMERAAAQHIERMRSIGMQVDLYTPSRFLSGMAPRGVRVVDVPWPSWSAGTGGPAFGWAYACWVKSLAEKLRQNEAHLDVVHFHGGAVGALRYWLQRGPVVVANPHGMEEFESASLLRTPNRLFSRALARQGRRADRVIATDASLVDSVVRNIGVEVRKVATIVNAVDVERLHSLALKARRDNAFTIVSIGRLVRNKGYDLLLDALKRSEVRAELPDGWRWIHFGAGDDAQTLVRSAATPPLVNLDLRSGWSDEAVQGELSIADMFVQPSRHEGSSLTTLEAMTHGVTIVATPVGGIPDKIKSGETGYLSAEASASSIAKALIAARHADSGIGRRAQEAVEAKFALDSAAKSYCALYEEALSENARKHH